MAPKLSILTRYQHNNVARQCSLHTLLFPLPTLLISLSTRLLPLSWYFACQPRYFPCQPCYFHCQPCYSPCQLCYFPCQPWIVLVVLVSPLVNPVFFPCQPSYFPCQPCYFPCQPCFWFCQPCYLDLATLLFPLSTLLCPMSAQLLSHLTRCCRKATSVEKFQNVKNNVSHGAGCQVFSADLAFSLNQKTPKNQKTTAAKTRPINAFPVHFFFFDWTQLVVKHISIYLLYICTMTM
jgi:hypothetical protein